MLGSGSSNAKIAFRELLISRYVPFSSLADNQTVRLHDGSYTRTWRLSGLSFEAMSVAEVLLRHNGFNQAVRSVGGGRTAIWSHRIRREVRAEIGGAYANAFAAYVASRYEQDLTRHPMLATELYFTLIHRPESARVKNIFGRTKLRSIEEIQRDEREALAELNEMAGHVSVALDAFGANILGVYERGGIRFSEQLEFYGFLLNGFWEPVAVTDSKLSAVLPVSRLSFGGENVEIRGASEVRYASMLDFKDYPAWSEPGALNGLLYEKFQFIETQSFSPLATRDALHAISMQKNRLIASEDVASAQIAQMNEAMEGLVAGQFLMGEYHYSLAVFGETLIEVGRNMSRARTALHDAGFQTALVDIVPDAAWFAQMPGNWHLRPREAKISSRNFCGLASQHNFSGGKKSGNPWGEAVCVLKTSGGQPFYFNFHASPAGEHSEGKALPANTLVIGQTGSGKTVVTLFLISQALKFKPTVVYFDKDRGAEIAIRAMDGNYFRLQRGNPTGLNPFAMDVTEQSVLFWEQLIKLLVRMPGQPLNAVEEEEISRAVRTVAAMPKAVRRISAVRQNLLRTGDANLNLRLKKWCWGESLGWLLDNPRDELLMASGRIVGFDYTDFIDDAEVRTPIMFYLLHRAEQLIDGTPFIYVMTEFWKLLGDPVFSDFAKNKQKTIRKQNGFGIFDTQSPVDILDSEIARTLVEQTATLVLLPNPAATRFDYVDGLKLTDAEFGAVEKLNGMRRSFLIKQGKSSAIAQLDLSALDDLLRVFSGTTENVLELDALRARVGDDPHDWLPLFLAKQGTVAWPSKSSAG